jgi:hypothetical protein
MALYLGSNKSKINLDGVVYCFNLSQKQSTKLLSFDGYTLKSLDGLRLTAMYTDISDFMFSSSDGYILTDFNELYLTTKESE